MTTSPDSVSAPSSQLDESLVGRMVNKYEIVRVIGRGGMGMVYEALNTTIGKRVAMKFVDAEMARNKDAVARFQREAQAASAVESAHIVEIFDSGSTDDGVPYIVMELLRGEDLGHRIKRCGRLELAEAAHVVAQILRGLHRAHEAGIVHRDLKPDNVFLVDRDDDPNFAKVLDFGISKVQRRGEVPAHTLTRQGTVLGTPFYMSPEQAQALSDVDGRTDLWSVGAILFECLTGRAPHTGSTYEQVIINICMKDVDDVRTHNPGVPEPIARVIAKALTRERDDRFGTAREFLDALASAAGGMISSRSARASGDDATTSHPGVGSTPGSRGRTPAATASDPASGYAPTLEVQGGGNSKVGWSTSGGGPGKRDRRLYVFVGAASLALGAVAAVYALREPGGGDAQGLAPAAPEVELQLTASAPGATFSADGAVLPGGVLKGTRGTKARVVVEAPGHATLETEITIEPATEPRRLVLTQTGPAPTVDPAGPVTEPATTPASTAAPTSKPRPAGGGRPIKPGPVAAPPPKTADPVAPPPPQPPPQKKGVANELKLKTE